MRGQATVGMPEWPAGKTARVEFRLICANYEYLHGARTYLS